MKIDYSKDIVNSAPPSAEKGTGPFDNPGIKPYETAVPETPGEKAMNPCTPEEMSKATPYKPAKTGSGYTG